MFRDIGTELNMLVLLLSWIILQFGVSVSSKCKPGFVGMNCTRENIAFGRQTDQSSYYKNSQRKTFGSELAVDGGVNTDFRNGTCTHTDQNDEKSYWYVDLDREVQSKDIEMVVYLRSIQGGRYNNFRIFINDNLCQRFSNLSTNTSSPPTMNPVTVTYCKTPLSGRRVTIKAATGDLTLCEVQIWECVDRYFGSCDKKCNCYNTFEVCDKTTGACLISGCRNGTNGTDCQTECPNRTYGRNCSGTCGQCRNSEPCNKTSGECQRGCEPGYRTSMCDTECEDGRYGANCTGRCGMCNNSVPCTKENGTCLHGCQAGYWTSTCHEECNPGYYGDECSLACGKCKEGTCHHMDGECRTGCGAGYTGRLCMELETQSNAGVVAGVMVLLLVAAASTTAVILWRKGLFRKEERYPMPQESVAVNMAEDDNYYENLPVDIPAQNLLHSIGKKRDENQFKEEYKLLRYGLAAKHTEGKKPENKKRNRFLELYPYDRTRVKLDPDGEDTWDYINASFVTCYRDEKVYIAAQGPKPVTVDDFWRMIWQQNARTIVMLTRLVEMNKKKCHQYWPEEGKTIQCGQISIVSDHCKIRSDYTIRQLRVQRKDCEQRTVTQFHFTQWPDHDVPAAPALVGFWKLFSAHHSRGAEGPPVVHCSAGVGRTGTFIALDSLARQADTDKKVNVFMCVFKMRESRVNMVQTVGQYEFVYHALLEALKSSDTLFTRPQFEEKYGNDGGYTHRQEEKFQQQYQSLIDLSLMKEDVISDGSLPENFAKNRNPHILPDKKSQLYLVTSVPDRNNYINAIVLPSVKRSQHYVVTQTPLPDTAVDFWRLVYDHECCVIVCLDGSQDAEGLYPESNTSMQVPPFKLHTVGSDHSDNWTHLKLKLKNSKKPKVTRNLDVFKFPVEKMESGVTSTASLLQFIDALHSCSLGVNQRILVHCLDGCHISGVFCSVMNVVSRLTLDNTVDILLTIRELQAHRHQFVQSYDQYKLCYDVAKEVIYSDNVYANL